MAPTFLLDPVTSKISNLGRRDIGGLSLTEVNLIVIGSLIGCILLASMGWAFTRIYSGSDEEMFGTGVRSPGQDQVNYMRQVRYRSRLGMFVAAEHAKKTQRDSKMTEEESSYHE